mgnify:CR=1 FL=1
MRTTAPKKPFFSLILATIHRENELEHFLKTIATQEEKDFELLIIDQNDPKYLEKLLSRWQSILPIRHFFSEPGLSKARNIGLRHANGEVICFPDDDCWYPQSLLSNLKTLFCEHPNIDGFTGMCVDATGAPSVCKWPQEPSLIDRYSVWKKSVSISIFIRKKISDQIGGFNESLGVGAPTPYQSGEETDFLLKALKLGAKIKYQPQIKVGHENPTPQFHSKAIKRGLLYGHGMGYVLSYHDYPISFVLTKLLRPFGGMLIYFAVLRFRQAQFHWNVFKGRLSGYLHQKIASRHVMKIS